MLSDLYILSTWNDLDCSLQWLGRPVAPQTSSTFYSLYSTTKYETGFSFDSPVFLYVLPYLYSSFHYTRSCTHHVVLQILGWFPPWAPYPTFFYFLFRHSVFITPTGCVWALSTDQTDWHWTSCLRILNSKLLFYLLGLVL